jgi:hypothetical protein
VKVYVGQTRGGRVHDQLVAAGIGECTQRGESPPRRFPWFLDNGAFRDWRHHRPFNTSDYRGELYVVENVFRLRPDFLLLPDIVAGGLDSLRFSESWIHRCQTVGPLYLAVQDGMGVGDVRPFLDAQPIAGLFVGGTSAWKIRSAHHWIRLAHERGLPCHIGRAGTVRKVRWAKRLGADSIDSSFPLWTHKRLAAFMVAISDAPPRQREMPL